MDDTTPELKRMVRERYEQMTPVERFLIGVQMFDTARAIALASCPPALTGMERRRWLCRRLYGSLADEAYGSDRRDGR